MIKIKGYPGYFLADDGKHIVGKWKRNLKPVNNCVILQKNGRRTCVPVNKLIWCAYKGVSPDDVPKGYSFREMNGQMMVETFSDRMSYARRKATNKVKMSNDQINYLKTYVEILEQIQNNEEGAQAKLFSFINNNREEYIAYTLKLQNNTNRDNAEIITDNAIMTTMEVICSNEMMVTNPKGCIKSFIRGFVREKRKFISNLIKIENTSGDI